MTFVAYKEGLGTFTAMTIFNPPEILAVGEVLLDLISTEYATDFRTADTYRRVPGGSPANLAMNLARLGRRVALIGTVGDDDGGDLLLDTLAGAGVDTRGMRCSTDPTTLILVTKSRAVSNFEPYRLADCQILARQFDTFDLDRVNVLHTTAFALSKEPARSTILTAFKKGAGAGATLSVDFNYADKIWSSDRAAGRAALTTIAEAGGMVKMSEVDFERLFGRAITDAEAAARVVFEMGATVVCLTLGAEGCYVLSAEGGFQLPANPVKVIDTTGAGDAFWSGFLAAYADRHDLRTCALAGRALAERKLTRLGPITERLTVKELLATGKNS